MKPYEMYNYITDKDKSLKDLIRYIDFMFMNKNYTHLFEDSVREDFEYHFDRIPQDMRRIVERINYEVLGGVASIEMQNKRLADKVKEYIGE